MSRIWDWESVPHSFNIRRELKIFTKLPKTFLFLPLIKKYYMYHKIHDFIFFDAEKGNAGIQDPATTALRPLPAKSGLNIWMEQCNVCFHFLLDY